MDRADLREIVIKSVVQMLISILVTVIVLIGIIYLMDPEGVQAIFLNAVLHR